MNQEWKRPESVLVVIYTRDLQVLLLERRQPAGFWQSVTGSLEWGENPQAAAMRELAEETGIQAEPRDCHMQQRFPILPQWRQRYAPEASTNLEHVFALMLPSSCEIRLNPAEHSRYQWLDKHTAMERCFSWTNREAIEKLVNNPQV